jgi:predicted unusual protein kinase regulating ubiquinone biosynthesis (AarF/ABC1/UbiB family)
VAIKIQYPHVARALAQDLANLRQLAHLGTGAGAVIDVAAQVAALRDALLAELDYRQERDALVSMHQVLAPWPDLVVPEPMDALCSRRVLTAAYLDGPTLHHLAEEEGEVDAGALSHLLVRAVLTPLLRADRLNADAHPGNFVVLDGPRLGLLDFGCVRDVDPDMVHGLRDFMVAVIEDPGVEVAAHFAAMGFGIDPGDRRDLPVTRAMRDLIAPTFTGPHAFAEDRTLWALGEYKQRHPVSTLRMGAPAPDMIHVFRALLGLLHGLRLLGATVDLSPTIREILGEEDGTS